LHDLAHEGIIHMVDHNTITILDPERLEQTAQG
jgi:hypothetical protein